MYAVYTIYTLVILLWGLGALTFAIRFYAMILKVAVQYCTAIALVVSALISMGSSIFNCHNIQADTTASFPCLHCDKELNGKYARDTLVFRSYAISCAEYVWFNPPIINDIVFFEGKV